MLPQLLAYYPWLKAIHVMCVLAWVGPQLVLGLLIVALRQLNTPQHVAFIGRTGFLVNSFMNMAMLGAFLLGGLMVSALWLSAGELPGWLWLKIGFVFALSTLHGLLFRQFRRAMSNRSIWHWQGYDWVQIMSLGTAFIIVALVIIKPMGHG